MNNLFTGHDIPPSLTLLAQELQKSKKQIIIAIDGRCASGKSTFAKKLSEKLNATVIHTDDFFLRPEQRTADRLNEPGGNFDRERFLGELFMPLFRNEAFVYRPYDCQTQRVAEAIELPRRSVFIVEGAYSCHPEINSFYDIRIFLTTDCKTQILRLKKRNPDMLNRFIKQWIPMEEKYFRTFKIADGCDFVLET